MYYIDKHLDFYKPNSFNDKQNRIRIIKLQQNQIRTPPLIKQIKVPTPNSTNFEPWTEIKSGNISWEV